MFDPSAYTIIASYFPRLIGLIYFFAIGAFIFQAKGLFGKNGILPIHSFLNSIHIYSWKKYLYIPTLFWIDSRDRTIMALIIVGTILSVFLMLGFYPSFLLLCLYLIHLSIVSAGQDFLSFGWEGFFLEISAQAFLMSLTPIPNLMVWISINFLLFRFHFQAGLVKLQSPDPSWKNLTAVSYHYQSQPLPNTFAWYAQKLPLWFQKFSTLMMFVIELAVPFTVFLTQEFRLVGFVAFFTLQFFIWLTGNFSYLNYLTVVLCTILLNDNFLSNFVSPPVVHDSPLVLNVILSFIGLILIGLQFLRLYYHFLPERWIGQIFARLSPFHLANRYTLFASMTKERFEVVIEGSADGLEWREYAFKYKPSELTYRPRRVAPYQPRLDWQAWFLPFHDFYSEEWFQKFLLHLLKGTPEVVKLLKVNPFEDMPPKYIRTLLYEYEFSSFNEKKEKGWWWRRELVGQYSPVVSLKLNPLK